jgi:hypothetical protein
VTQQRFVDIMKLLAEADISPAEIREWLKMKDHEAEREKRRESFRDSCGRRPKGE